jgi:hypothetical protein
MTDAPNDTGGFADAFGEMPGTDTGTSASQGPANTRAGGSGSSEPPMPPPLSSRRQLQPEGALLPDDFLAYPAKNKCLYRPTREFWSVDGLNACFPARLRMKFSTWMARNGQRVDSVAWHPNEEEIVHDKIAVRNGWLPQPGARTFNMYLPPIPFLGDPAQAQRWADHVKALYPDDWKIIIAWLAHRVQCPGIKPNFCIVLAGDPGISKDTLICPIRDAVGPWNFEEIQLHTIGSVFNDYQSCVLLRISEARDSGDGTARGRIDRYTLDDRMKALLATPPETFRINRKYEAEYQAFNICGVIITTNHIDALYLTHDDRRYLIAMSQRKAAEFSTAFFDGMYHWYYEQGGIGHVIAYLRAYDLSQFNPHEAPPKTAAFWNMVDIDRGPEFSELEDALDALGKPDPNDPEKIIPP